MNLQFKGCTGQDIFDDALLTHENGYFSVAPVYSKLETGKDGGLELIGHKPVIGIHITPYGRLFESDRMIKSRNNVQITAAYELTHEALPVSYDEISGGFIIKLPENCSDNEERIRITAVTQEKLQIPVRILAMREGKARIQPDGVSYPCMRSAIRLSAYTR